MRSPRGQIMGKGQIKTTPTDRPNRPAVCVVGEKHLRLCGQRDALIDVSHRLMMAKTATPDNIFYSSPTSAAAASSIRSLFADSGGAIILIVPKAEAQHQILQPRYTPHSLAQYYFAPRLLSVCVLYVCVFQSSQLLLLLHLI
jgi:hypothetical protein